MASTEACLFSALTLKDLRYDVRLGCGSMERAVPQAVCFEIQLRFQALPPACLNDHLEDTVCFDRLNQIIHSVCAGKEYHLLEKLTYEAFQAVKRELSHGTLLQVKAIKVKPPIDNLEGGASFQIGDWA